MTNYTPIIKGPRFCPNPIAMYGIPDFANSQFNPKVVDTLAYQDFWAEQIDRCINGYETGGINIPGRYYFYLNFAFISTVGRGYHYPDYVDLDLEYFRFIDEIKEERVGAIILKARRKGLSEKMSKGVMSYEFRFRPDGYSCGICAGLETYSKAFYLKFKEFNNMVVPELKLHLLKDDAKEVIAGYEYKADTGFVKDGSFNKMMCRTMGNNPNIFKGEKLDDAVFEEAGEFPMLIKSFKASEDCFKIGGQMIGTPYVYGTGGNIKAESKDFREMWNEAESFNLRKFEVWADRLFVSCFVGSTNEKGEIKEDVPNISALYSEEQRIGMEDVERAREKILATKKFLAQSRNKDNYYDYLQNNPLNAKEAFLDYSNNQFDIEALTEQRFNIDSQVYHKARKYALRWVKNEDGTIKTPYEVSAIPVENNYIGDDLVYISYHPVKGYKDLYCAGIDSYDLDQTRTSKSLGAMVVLARKNNPHNKGKRIPCLLIRNRPKRKEAFYDLCLRAAVYYGLKKSVLIDYAKGLVIQYFKDNGGEKFLAKRPKAFESDNSEQQHDYGVSLNTFSKPRMIALLQTFVHDDIDECWFPEIIEELQTYDTEAKDSDADAADALGIALMEDVDMKRDARTNEDEKFEEDPYELGEWVSGPDGRMVLKNNSKSKKLDEEITDPFMRMLHGLK